MPQQSHPAYSRKSGGEPPSYVFVLTWAPTEIGGVNEVVFALANQVEALGYTAIIAIASWSPQEHDETWRGLRVTNLQLRDLSSSGFGLKSIAAFLSTALPDAMTLRRFVRQHNVRVLNLHFASLAALLPAMMRSIGLLPTRLMLCFHGSDIAELSNGSPVARAAWRFILKHCDALTAPSESLVRQIRKLFPAATPRRVYNGVDEALFNVERVKSPRPVIIHVGKFDNNKAQDVTLRAVQKLLDEGFCVDLILVGSAGSALDEVRHLIKELKLDSHVQLHVGLPHEAIPSLMARADVLVLPSRNESFGLVLVEAGVVGLPVIATCVGGIPELISDYKTGLLISPDQPSELADAIRMLLTDTPLAARLASEWHKEVLERFTWRKAAEGYFAAAGLTTPEANTTSV
jgi:glycosyltransferase involved in cell wall biosynthesis